MKRGWLSRKDAETTTGVVPERFWRSQKMLRKHYPNKEHPKALQRRPKALQRRPKVVQKRTQGAPRLPRSLPKASQGAPKATQKRSKSIPRLPRAPQKHPKASQCFQKLRKSVPRSDAVVIECKSGTERFRQIVTRALATPNEPTWSTKNMNDCTKAM